MKSRGIEAVTAEPDVQNETAAAREVGVVVRSDSM
jgi:hypothetical protein